MVKISDFPGLSFLKGKLVEPESFAGDSYPDTKGLWKTWDKTESWFHVQTPNKLLNFFWAGKKVKISNFIGFFFVKGKPEIFTRVSCSDTEGLWKVWGKTESTFAIQLPKNLENFFRVGEKVKISNFICFFFVKGKLVEPETFTGVSCPGTEGLWRVWG